MESDYSRESSRKVQLGISGMTSWATGVTMRPESSSIEFGEIASGVWRLLLLHGWMLDAPPPPSHLGSKLDSAPLTFGVHGRYLSGQK